MQNIFTIASDLRKKYPTMFKTWQKYVQEAKKINRQFQGKKKVKVSPKIRKEAKKISLNGLYKKKSMPAKRKRAPRRKAGHRPRKRIGESGVSTKSRTHTDYNRNKVNITVGSVNKDKKRARDKLEHLIGKEVVKQFKAKKKPLKKRIGKKITKLKSEYRRLA